MIPDGYDMYTFEGCCVNIGSCSASVVTTTFISFLHPFEIRVGTVIVVLLDPLLSRHIVRRS